MAVYSILPRPLTGAVASVLEPAGVAHVAHGDRDPVRAASVAAADSEAMAPIGPFRSADVADAVEATAPAGLPLIAPVATWVGVTRDDEPGWDDAARHRGTVLRIVARDSVVAQRIAGDIAASGERALVVAGEHDYGRQLDAQLRAHGLPRTDDPARAHVVVLAGLAGEPEASASPRWPRCRSSRSMASKGRISERSAISASRFRSRPAQHRMAAWPSNRVPAGPPSSSWPP